ncbi:hypothetical protein VDGL01_11132 [Verticillium dahliae]
MDTTYTNNCICTDSSFSDISFSGMSSEFHHALGHQSLSFKDDVPMDTDKLFDTFIPWGTAIAGASGFIESPDASLPCPMEPDGQNQHSAEKGPLGDVEDSPNWEPKTTGLLSVDEVSRLVDEDSQLRPYDTENAEMTPPPYTSQEDDGGIFLCERECLLRKGSSTDRRRGRDQLHGRSHTSSYSNSYFVPTGRRGSRVDISQKTDLLYADQNAGAILDQYYLSSSRLERLRSPVACKRAGFIPTREVKFARKHDERRDTETGRTDALDYRNPFPVSWLLLLYARASFGARYDGSTAYNAHLEASLVEVIDIVLRNAVFRDCVAHIAKPRVYRDWVFALGSSIVVFAKTTRLEIYNTTTTSMSKNSWPQTDEVGPPLSVDAPESQVQDSSYVPEDSKKGPVPVLKDDDTVEDPINPKTADSEKALEQDEKEALDKSSIMKDRTRHAKPKGRYTVDQEEDPALLE